MIIHEPTSPKLPRKPFSLYGIGIDAEFVRLHHFHTYNYICFFVRCKVFLHKPAIHPPAEAGWFSGEFSIKKSSN